MLPLIILVSLVILGAAVYGLMRYSAVRADQKKKEEEENRKKLKQVEDLNKKNKMEIKMHQEEVVMMAKSSPETVARIVKNWLT